MDVAPDDARIELAREFAEQYELSQAHYRSLLHAIRDHEVGLRDFDGRAYVLYRNLTRLKHLKMRLEELKRVGGGPKPSKPPA